MDKITEDDYRQWIGGVLMTEFGDKDFNIINAKKIVRVAKEIIDFGKQYGLIKKEECSNIPQQ